MSTSVWVVRYRYAVRQRARLEQHGRILGRAFRGRCLVLHDLASDAAAGVDVQQHARLVFVPVAEMGANRSQRPLPTADHVQRGEAGGRAAGGVGATEASDVKGVEHESTESMRSTG